MNEDVLHIIRAQNNEFQYSGFFRMFKVEDLREALRILEEEDRAPTIRRRMMIHEELNRRQMEADRLGVPIEDVRDVLEKGVDSVFDHAPRIGSKFMQEWNETCRSIYEKIQFMDDIPLVRRG